MSLALMSPCHHFQGTTGILVIWRFILCVFGVDHLGISDVEMVPHFVIDPAVDRDFSLLVGARIGAVPPRRRGIRCRRGSAGSGPAV